MDAERENLVRQYAAGEITWRALQRRGIDNFREVLAGLGELGLRPPVAPMDGPNVELRRRAAPPSARCWPKRSQMTFRLGLLVIDASPFMTR